MASGSGLGLPLLEAKIHSLLRAKSGRIGAEEEQNKSRHLGCKDALEKFRLK